MHSAKLEKNIRNGTCLTGQLIHEKWAWHVYITDLLKKPSVMSLTASLSQTGSHAFLHISGMVISLFCSTTAVLRVLDLHKDQTKMADVICFNYTYYMYS